VPATERGACRFCGNDEVVVRGIFGEPLRFYVCCPRCGARGPITKSDSLNWTIENPGAIAAIDAWNKGALMRVTADMVRRLRDATDAPMVECKRALVETNCDFDKAKEQVKRYGLC